jgi:hypothetical protein
MVTPNVIRVSLKFIQMFDYSNKNLLFSISIMAACIGCIADILLLYHPDGNYHLGDYQFFLDISKGRMIPGYYLGILFIAFELLGFWLVSKAIFPKEKQKNSLFFASICFLFLLGVVYHAAVTFIGVIIKETPNGLDIINQYQSLFRPLEIIMGIFLIIPTFFIIQRVLKGNTLLPKWIVFFNPVLVYGIIILFYLFIPIIGNLLIVAGFNLSNGIFLAACFYALRNTSLKTRS